MNKLVFFLTLNLYSQISAAVDIDTCKSKLQKLSANFQEDAANIVEDYQSVIKKIEKRYIKKHGKQKASDFHHFQSRLEKKGQFDYYVTEYTEMFPKTILEIAEKSEQQHFCEDLSRLDDLLEEHEQQFGGLLENIEEKIIERVKLDELSKNEGLVVIVIRSNYRNIATEYILKSESLFGDNITIGPIGTSYHFEVVKLPEGKYYWEKIKWNKNNYGYSYFNFKNEKLSFQVEKGKLNFAGEFLSNVINGNGYGDVSDRSSMMLQMMEIKFPLLLKNFSWTNALVPHDPFLGFYKQQIMEVSDEE
ncbi:hypothetical protein HII17_10340 [Thalassotalea sp. M1531]|uniref:Uncharacterized protein n=1 Tax=Thalassotalea algicola TaxID=2716224 RepID=A0A7Y0LE36_9GAMM|nr:hypothetical protein [Thalassotalea algicola]NMP31966.1 hypothetical protein [Thalassotalea algicola]